MHNLLSKILKKKGINSVAEMTDDERNIFEQWNKVLSGENMTVDSVSQFCKSQISVIESKWKDMNMANSSKAELIPYHTVYKMIIAAIEAPRSEVEALERQLNELLK